MEIFLKKVRLGGMPYPKAELKNEALSVKLRDRLRRGEHETAEIWLTDDAGEAGRLTGAGECVVYLLTGKNRERYCDGVLWCVETPEAENTDGKNQEGIRWKRELSVIEKEGFPEWLSEVFLWRVWLRGNDLPWHICETERLALREMMEEDLDFVLEMQKEEQSAGRTWVSGERPAAWMPVDEGEIAAQARAEELEKLAAYRKQMYGLYGFGIWLVLEKENGLPVGRVGLQMRDGFPGPELGFSIAVPYRQRGYAEEACRAVLALAWEELEADRLYAVVDRENMKSVSLCKKLGFVSEREESGSWLVLVKNGLANAKNICRLL